MEYNTKNMIYLLFFLCLLVSSCSQQGKPQIYYPEESSSILELSGKEIKKYIYQRTNSQVELSKIQDWNKISGNSIILVNLKGTSKEKLPKDIIPKITISAEEDFQLINNGNRLYILGGSEIAVLYGAYRYAEKLGVRFYLHGDVIPDKLYEGSLVKLQEESNSPLFNIRGILPFHDFPEGPDWWNEDNYKAYFTQLAKLRMNFFSLHTYPEEGPHAEPSIWIGTKENIASSGDVTYSYPSTFANTLRPGYWGYAPLATGEFCAGASQLFESDIYGADILKGTEPFPHSMDSMNLLFNRAGKMFASSYGFGQQLGLKFCMGTETPLTIPKMVRDKLLKERINPESDEAIRLIYEGIFSRITQTHPLDYYWLWTPESWTWGNPTNQIVDATINDIRIANEVLDEMDYPFELGLSGWVLGPPQNRSGFDAIVPERTAISCISRMWGQDRIERGFDKIKTNRPKWAIPWLEEDPRMTIPQFWAGRMRADAADALKYGCTGLIGIHWRTRSIAPNVNALAEAAWKQSAWNPDFGKPYIEEPMQTEDVRIEGKVNPDDGRIIKGTNDSPVFSSLCYDMQSYLIKVPNGTYTVRLQFCETVYDQVGKRIFGVNVEGEEVATHLDVFAKVGKNAAYEIVSRPIPVKDGILNIDFNVEVENPFISGIVIEGKTEDVNQVKGSHFRRAINAGGIAYKDYEADLPEGTGMESPLPRDLESYSFYLDYATHEFGEEVAESAASIFVSIDGFHGNGGNDQVKIPRPANWISNSGPGAVMPNTIPWEEEKAKYAFVDQFSSLKSGIIGVGNLERFNYWDNTFQYTKAMAKAGCTRGEIDLLIGQISKEKEVETIRKRINNEVMPLRIRLAREWELMMSYLLQTVYTPGELGTVANIEQLSRKGNEFLSKHDSFIEKSIGSSIPEDAHLSNKYTGPTRIVLLTERSLIAKNEELSLKATILSSGAFGTPVVKYRIMGKGNFQSIPMELLTRNTYHVILPKAPTDIMEYYVTLESGGKSINYPSTAPQINNTVIEF